MPLAQKLPVNPIWFNQLPVAYIEDSYRWLTEIGISADKIADFGCWTGVEPFALLWTLDASEIVVIDVQEKHINEFNTRLTKLQHINPMSLQGRTIRTIVADMTLPIPNLVSDYFDLSYCADVLYSMRLDVLDKSEVQRAVNEMARVVRPSGHVLAIEPKMGVEFETTEEFWGSSPKNDPVDISELFVNAGLVISLN